MPSVRAGGDDEVCDVGRDEAREEFAGQSGGR